MRAARLAVAAAVSVAVVAPRLASAFFEQTEVGARGVAMGRTLSAAADDASAIYWNPGGLGFLEQPEVHFTHHRPYLVQDLALSFAAVAWPAEAGTFWVAWSRLGLDGVMAEDLFYLGAARRLEWGARSLSAGASLKVARVDFRARPATATGEGEELDAQSKVLGDFGVLLRWSPRLTAGWVVRNLGEPEFDFVPGGGGSVIEIRHEGGIAYRWHPDARLAVAVVEGSDGGAAAVAGAEIRFYDVFDLRAGVGDLKFFGGVGVRTERVRVDTSFATHNTLGISTMVSLSFALGRWS